MKKRGVMFFLGMLLLSLAVVIAGCGGGSSSSSSGDGTTYTVSGTVFYDVEPVPSEAGAEITLQGITSEVALQGITVEARNPSDDSVFDSTTTDANGAFSLTVPANQDFYLHATGATINNTAYVSVNLQIMQLSADRSGIALSMLTEDDMTQIGLLIGDPDRTANAFFGFDVVDDNGNGIEGVTVSASPPGARIFCQQIDGNFKEGYPTSTESGPSVVGYVSGGSGTYTFTLSGGTGFTIDVTFRLRLIPGEVSIPTDS